MKIISRKEIFFLSPSLSCSNESNSSRKGTRLIDEIRSGSSRNSLRHQFLFASIFFFSFTHEENCSVITDIPSGRGDEYNGGILFVVSIYEFSSNDNSPPGGRREQRPPFFLSLSPSQRSGSRREEHNWEAESGRKGDLSFLWSFPPFEKDLLMKIEMW